MPSGCEALPSDNNLGLVAEEENRTREELVREAVERYLKDRRWQRLLAYGEQQTRALGLSDADVPRLIEDYRRQSR